MNQETINMNNILRERPIPGCDNVIVPAPLKCFVREGGELKEVFINLDDYKKIGFNKDYEFYSLKSEK